MTEDPVVEEPDGIDETGEIISVTAEYLSDPVTVITVEDVFDLVQAGDMSIQIVDIRSAEHFEAGHIEGAIHMPFNEIWMEDQLDRLDADKRIITVCYTGQTASMATMLWQQLGYDVVPMRFGMTGWSADPALHVADTLPSGEGKDYPVETEPFEVDATYDIPTLDTGAATVEEALVNAAERYFAKELPAVMSVDDAFEIFTADDPGYQFLDVREAEHYALAHIPTAFNIPWKEIASEDELRMIDPDKTVIVTCYTGHLASQVSMFLNELGYDTINLSFGMSSWVSDPELRVVETYDPDAVPDYPVVEGAAE